MALFVCVCVCVCVGCCWYCEYESEYCAYCEYESIHSEYCAYCSYDNEKNTLAWSETYTELRSETNVGLIWNILLIRVHTFWILCILWIRVHTLWYCAYCAYVVGWIRNIQWLTIWNIHWLTIWNIQWLTIRNIRWLDLYLHLQYIELNWLHIVWN